MGQGREKGKFFLHISLLWRSPVCRWHPLAVRKEERVGGSVHHNHCVCTGPGRLNFHFSATLRNCWTTFHSNSPPHVLKGIGCLQTALMFSTFIFFIPQSFLFQVLICKSENKTLTICQMFCFIHLSRDLSSKYSFYISNLGVLWWWIICDSTSQGFLE